MSSPIKTKPITATTLRERKGGQKITALTAYDTTFAKLFDEQVDLLLVGDSLGMVVQGQPNTLSVTVDQMIYHSEAVSRGITHAHLCVDMPFLSYQISEQDAVRNAGRLIQEGKAHSVKLEGGVVVAPTVAKIVDMGIPVLGHIGLTPQSYHAFGGYRVQGRSSSAQDSIVADALALESAGAYAIVLEGIPVELAKTITERVKVPTIGIGAGVHCDGQILVSYDLLGLNPTFHAKFVKHYANLSETIVGAVQQYVKEVQDGTFPDSQHSFK